MTESFMARTNARRPSGMSLPY